MKQHLFDNQPGEPDLSGSGSHVYSEIILESKANTGGESATIPGKLYFNKFYTLSV
jgi:hypothetical protein